MRPGTTLSLLLLSALSLGACGDDRSGEEERLEEFARQHGVDADVEIDEDGERIVTLGRNAGGVRQQAGANLGWPDGFPEDIAVFPDLNVYSASGVPGGGYTVAALAVASPDDVAAFYRREMASRGWTDLSATGGAAPGPMLRFEKGTRMVTVNLVPNGESTALTITTLDRG